MRKNKTEEGTKIAHLTRERRNANFTAEYAEMVEKEEEEIVG